MRKRKRGQEFLKDFQSRLRDAMRGSSIRKVAQKTSLSQSAVRQYLSNRSAPTIVAVHALAAGLGVRAGWLVDGHGPSSMEAGEDNLGSLISTKSLREALRIVEYTDRLATSAGAPFSLDEKVDQIIDFCHAAAQGKQALPTSYEQLLDWAARHVAAAKRPKTS